MSDALWVLIWTIPLIVVEVLARRSDARDHGREFDRLIDIVSEISEERKAWAVERQQLLDRIQAPSFGEYKQAEIKLEKVRSGEKDPQKLEQL